MKPHLVVATTLQTPQILTLDTRGERDSGTVLGTSQETEFRVENFAFYDMTTSKAVVHDLFPGTCEPDRKDFVELRASERRVTSMLLHENDPTSDPVNILQPGHEYRITLKPQTIKCWTGGVEGLLARLERPEEQDSATVKFTDNMMVTLACDNELILKVEA